MRPARRAHLFLAAATAATLSLSGCMAASSESDGGVTPAAADSPAAAPVETTAIAAPPSSPAPSEATATAAPPVTSAPAPAGTVTFTFPDGRLSFAHPEGWRVKYEQVAASPSVETATVSDASGNEQINIYYSQIGDGTAGPASRTVIETDPVLGLRGHFVPTPHSSFFVDRTDGAAQYRMSLTAGLPVSPDGQVQHGLIMLGDRILAADVLFSEQPFADDQAAKDWYWGAEGQALKSVLMSFSYR